MIGISFGGLVSDISMGIDERIKDGVFIIFRGIRSNHSGEASRIFSEEAIQALENGIKIMARMIVKAIMKEPQLKRRYPPE